MAPAEDPDYSPVPLAAPLRSRRKCAKAAGLFIAAAVKEDMLAPPAPPSASKRSYARANSITSIASTVSTGSLSHHNASSVAKDSKGRPKKKTALSSYAVEYLKAWMMSPDHIEHPYPTEDEKLKIMKETSIELKQLTNWFVNNRKRYWKPKVEEMRRQSGNLNVSLQEIAARAQCAGTVAQIAAINSGAHNAPRKNSLTNTVASSAASSAMLVSSEGEQSEGSMSSMNMMEKKIPKKRKKYSTLTNNEDNNNGKALLASEGARSNPSRSAKKAKEAHNATTAAGVANPMGIHTASTHASVKAARERKDFTLPTKISSTPNVPHATLSRSMSRVISETSSSSETESSDCEMSPLLKPAQVSNPLGSLGCMSSSSAIDSIVNDPIISCASSGSIADTGIPVASSTQASRVVQTEVPATAAANIAAELDYSISPLDSAVLANTINPGTAATTAAAQAQANAAANAGFCCSIMPHSCNDSVDPCALCSACRDWNLGEFCPWDLTGIIGDLSTDLELKDPTKEEMMDLCLPVTKLATVTSSGTTSDMEGSAQGREEATTVTKSSNIDCMADLASLDAIMEPHLVASSATVPQEISHSKSSTDFMHEIESW